MKMPSIFNYLKRPEYVFRPRQVLHRLSRLGKATPPVAIVTLPWGAALKVNTCEHIGNDIFHYGIFDRIVPEAIFRLADPGEFALEIGANIGQNSSLMATRVGSKGRVLAFEPHPQIFLELKENHERSRKPGIAPVQLECVALGQMNGTAVLVEKEEFSRNRGSATLTSELDSEKGINVSVRRLDDFLSDSDRVGVCKIDVEGHELAVLKGAQNALRRGAIRDIIFEDFSPKPSPVTEFLAQNGFTLFELHESWVKPRPGPMREANTNRSNDFSFNYLATLDVGRAIRRFRRPGWRCLLNV